MPLDPLPTSEYWVTTPSSVLADAEASELAVRLGLSLNAVLAQQRFLISAINEQGTAAARDRISAFTVAAAIVEETRITINGSYKRVMAFAKLGEVPPELLQQYAQLNSGKGPLGPILNSIRNKLTFHWDPAAVRESLKDFREYPTLIWQEGTDTTIGQSVYRLSSDVLTNAIWPESADARSLPSNERLRRVQETTRAGMDLLLEAMSVVTRLLEHAIAGYLDQAGGEAHRRQP